MGNWRFKKFRIHFRTLSSDDEEKEGPDKYSEEKHLVQIPLYADILWIKKSCDAVDSF